MYHLSLGQRVLGEPQPGGGGQAAQGCQQPKARVMESAIILQERRYHTESRPLMSPLATDRCQVKATSLSRIYAKHSSMSASLKDSEQWEGFDGLLHANSILNSLLSYLTLFR